MMNSEGFERKLSAILSADVAGYSRLMNEDDDATVRILKGHREMMSVIIEKHKGRVVDSPGDNMLAEFGSALQSVECAVEIQKELSEKNSVLPVDRRLVYRIGVNVGDVIKEEDRIYGDGVNIAARLEAMAEPGGICISGIAYTHVKNKLKLDYKFLGRQAVKNIPEPIPVYCIKSLPEITTLNGIGKEPVHIPSHKPSIAVLPFVNMSHDPEQEYFSDGMAEEIIGALAKLEGLKVISRTSAFYFKGQKVDLRTIGEQLKVDHVLEGSVRKAGNKIRVSAQLINVSDDTHLWAETFDRELEDVFAIQDEISQRVVEKLKTHILGKVPQSNVKVRTDNIDAYEAFIKGRYYWSSFTEGGIKKALQHYQQAISIDPNYAPVYSAIAELYWGLPFLGKPESIEYAYGKAREAIDKALDLDHRLAEAHATLGLIRWTYEWDWKGAEHAFQTAVKLNPGSSKSHYDFAMFLALVPRKFSESIAEARKAIELDPLSGNAHYVFGTILFVSGQVDHAIEELRLARKIIPLNLPSISSLVHAYLAKGMLQEAFDEAKMGLHLFPKNSLLLYNLGILYAQSGQMEKTRRILDRMLRRSERQYVGPLSIALLSAIAGDGALAGKWLMEGYRRHDPSFALIGLILSGYSTIQNNPTSVDLYGALEKNPVFQDLLNRMGLMDPH